MKFKYLFSVIPLWSALGCSEAAMQGGQQTSQAQGVVEKDGQTPATNAGQSSGENVSNLNPVAVEPVSVSGAYLVCIQAQDVDCRVDSDTQKNIAVDPSFQLKFYYQGQPVTAGESKRAGWRWKLNPQNLLFGSVEVRLQFALDGAAKRELTTVYEVSPMQIGDGSGSVQPGCNGEIGTQSQPFALEFIKSFKLEKASSVVIDMVGVCGIVLSNDAYVQVSNSSGEEVFKGFFPSTRSSTDLKFIVPELAIGDYSLRIHASDKYEIDDFYIRNLSVSLRGP